jgi:hypothetical protein
MVRVWGRREAHNYVGKHEGKKRLEDLYSDGNRPNTDLRKKNFDNVNWILLASDSNTRGAVTGEVIWVWSLQRAKFCVVVSDCWTLKKKLLKVEIVS